MWYSLRSIGAKFVITIGCFGVLLCCFLLYRTYVVGRRQARDLMNQQAALALEFDLAIREYVAEEIRPRTARRIGQDEFEPETMSTSYVARSVFEKVRRKFPDYIIKFSSDNPRNPTNKAGPDESKIIDYFNRNPESDTWTGEVSLDGIRYMAHFRARRMKQSCLRCHGKPEDAPASLLARYGTQAGFGRSVGDVVALDTVAIPVAKVEQVLASEVISQSILMIIGLGLLFGAIVLVFRFMIAKRLKAMVQHFRNMATAPEGAQIRTIDVPGRDEIGALATSFNTLAGKLQVAHTDLENRIAERTDKLQRINEELSGEVAERQRAEEQLKKMLEEQKRFGRLSTGRELRMIELKREVNEMAVRAGTKPPYDLSFAETHGQGVGND